MKLIKPAAVLIGISLAFSGCSLFGGDEPSPDIEKPAALADGVGNTGGNIVNLGGAVKAGKYIYCQNGEDGYKLYRTDKNGENGEKLTDCAAYFINVTDDYIYYCNGDESFHIYRMKTDGSDNTLILERSANYMTVSNGYIYYVDMEDGQTPYRMSADGSEKIQLSDMKAEYINVDGDDVYFCNYDDPENYGLRHVNYENRFVETVIPYYCGYLNVTEDYFYFTDIRAGANKSGTNKLFRVSRSDYSDSECVLESETGIFNIADNKIYYVNYDDNDNIYCCELDGSGAKKFVDEQAKYIAIAGSRIFYLNIGEDKKTMTLKDLDFSECGGK